jgi:glycyl-tRNA synthetase alpha chain
VEDDWESHPGASGLGWEVWLDGMEITQFTYFQMAGSIELTPVSVELTYGLERIAMYLQQVDNVYDLQWNRDLRYGDVHHRQEVEQSTYNFEQADVSMLFDLFARYEAESGSSRAGAAGPRAPPEMLPHQPLDTRGAISVGTHRPSRIRNLARACGGSPGPTEGMGFPLVKEN